MMMIQGFIGTDDSVRANIRFNISNTKFILHLVEQTCIRYVLFVELIKVINVRVLLRVGLSSLCEHFKRWKTEVLSCVTRMYFSEIIENLATQNKIM